LFFITLGPFDYANGLSEIEDVIYEVLCKLWSINLINKTNNFLLVLL